MAKAPAAKAANPFAKKGGAQKVPTMKKPGKAAAGGGKANPFAPKSGKGMVAPPARKAK